MFDIILFYLNVCDTLLLVNFLLFVQLLRKFMLSSRARSSSKSILLLVFPSKVTNKSKSSFKAFVSNSTCSLNHKLKHLVDISGGLSIHTDIIKRGLNYNLYVMNSLVGVYAELGFIENSRQVFDEMPQKNLVSWNMMISGYKACVDPKLTLEFCGKMRHEGVALDAVGLKIVLPVCGHAGALRAGESIHASVMKSGLPHDTALLTAILDMYAKCGRLDASEQLFDEILRKDIVCWNAMISGYSRAGVPELVLELFKKVLVEDLKPSIPTVLLSLQACTQLSDLQTGKAIHCYIVRISFDCDVSVGGLLIDMYSRCGEFGSACCVFNGMTMWNVNSWTCLINGLGVHGYGMETLMSFFQMLKKGIEPDGICFLSILSSCSHTGILDDGQKMFSYMVEQFSIQPTMEHYVSMVDLIARSGNLQEAFEFVCEMPMEPDEHVVGALLGACRTHGHLQMARVFGEWLIRSGWSIAGFYKLLVGIYAGTDRWDEVVKIRRIMEKQRWKGIPGCSVIAANR